MANSGHRCPVCGHRPLRRTAGTPRLAIGRCPRCGQHVAEHRAAGSLPDVDYHRQYEAGDFVESLGATRRHQARAILERVRAQLEPAEDLLDFGAGRGWFLEEARASGMHRLAGADTSSDSVIGLRENGIEGLLIAPPSETAWDLDLGRLSFRPRVLVLLDVIEHFPAERLSSMFGDIVDQVGPQLELVVVKVPVAEGLLYRTARWLARGRVAGPLEQLYQVGTSPPHFSYFTRRSLKGFLTQHGLRTVDELGLLEFDPSTFGSRVAVLRGAPRAATRIVGAAAAFVAERTWRDSHVVLARPAGTQTRT